MTQLERQNSAGPGRHSAPDGCTLSGQGSGYHLLPLACLYRVNSQTLHWLPEPGLATPLGHMLPLLYGRHCRGARHILKEAPFPGALFSLCHTAGHVLSHSSYYVKQVLAATEVGVFPKARGPHRDLLEMYFSDCRSLWRLSWPKTVLAIYFTS